MYLIFIKIENSLNATVDYFIKITRYIILKYKIRKQMNISFRGKKLERLLNDPLLSNEKRDEYRLEMRQICLKIEKEFEHIGTLYTPEEMIRNAARKKKYIRQRLRVRPRGKFQRLIYKNESKKKITKMIYVNLNRNTPLK